MSSPTEGSLQSVRSMIGYLKEEHILLAARESK